MRLRRYGFGLLVLLAIAVAGAALAYPAAAAVACPACFGFEPISAETFVAGQASTPETAALVAAAEERVRTFYGSRESDPRVLICGTEACYARIGGGGSRGMALLDKALFVSPRGTDIVIVSHELSHLELHHRLGLVKTLRRDVPQWFDEGLAVNVSDDPRYLGPREKNDRCLVSSDEALPTDRRSWLETAANRDLYAKAACRVSRWLAAHDGSKGLLGLVARVTAGVPFEEAYARPLG